MASEKQFEFFKFLYDEEEQRAHFLQEHAKNNLTLATLYSAFVIFVIEKLRPDSAFSKSIFIATVVFMLLAFLLSLWGSQISNYEALTDPDDIIEEYGDEPPSDEEFFDNRIADISVAYRRNSLTNDKKAIQLQFARYCLLAGVAFHACYFIIRMI